MKITIWNTVNNKGKVAHNHIENGWSSNIYPLPLKDAYANQKSWANMQWIKRYAYLVDNKITYNRG